MIPERSNYLAKKVAERTHTEAELAEIMDFLRTAPRHQAEAWMDEYGAVLPDKDIPGIELPGLTGRIAALAGEATEERNGKLRTLWKRWGAAAAVLLVLGSGMYWWLGKRNGVAEKPVIAELKDVDPGKAGAVLTLADGTQVVLDSMGNGWATAQNGTRVLLKDGQLAYDPANAGNGTIAYNTMTTPRGRQFRIVLPDGTKVWLNAASSIYYPTAFTGAERKVKITGEAYFEVAAYKQEGARKAWPFIVDVDGRAHVKVLGTHFNISAYKNEAAMQTTLLEGAVKVALPNTRTEPLHEVTLRPGMQARISNKTGSPVNISVDNTADLAKVMAWKEGVFNFEDVGLEEAMRQLERWYDIDVVYEKGVPDIYFFGKISRDMPLKSVLKMLEDSEVRFRLEAGRKLVVLP